MLKLIVEWFGAKWIYLLVFGLVTGAIVAAVKQHDARIREQEHNKILIESVLDMNQRYQDINEINQKLEQEKSKIQKHADTIREQIRQLESTDATVRDHRAIVVPPALNERLRAGTRSHK